MDYIGVIASEAEPSRIAHAALDCVGAKAQQ
jgi:hypothetical protein